MILPALSNVSKKTCPICSYSESEILLDLKPRYEIKSSLGVPSTARIIFKCNTCGAFFSDDESLAKDQELNEMYDETYHDSLTGSVKNENQSGVMEQNAIRLKLLKEFTYKGDLLDIGCNTGHFLYAAQNAGYKVYGMEPSDFACRLARERFNCGEDRIEKATVTESKLFDTRKFDVITLWDVMEHFYTLHEDLQCINNALKKDGVLVIRTPDNASIFFQLAILAHKLSFGRFDYPAISIFHNDHNFFFSKNSLKMLLSEMGFSVLKIAPDPLTWKKFCYCELNGRNFFLKTAIGFLYWLSRMSGGGHGVLVVAKKL